MFTRNKTIFHTTKKSNDRIVLYGRKTNLRRKNKNGYFREK